MDGLLQPILANQLELNLTITNSFLYGLQQDGCLQIHWGTLQEEAVGCPPFLAPRSLLGIPSIERYSPCFPPLPP